MSRDVCSRCQRALKACICQFFIATENIVHVVVLQHPSEVKQTKGSIKLLSQSLKHCDVFVGEDFNQHSELFALLESFSSVALLYPSEAAEVISHNDKNTHLLADNGIAGEADLSNEKRCLIILDGTWKKAYKMFMKNSWLNDISHIALPDGFLSQYHIRKTEKKNALSSLEACCYALSLLENNDQEKYKTLIDNFVKFNQFQLSFSPNRTI